MQVVILCGGSGTRAYPFTAYLPKPMIPICGSPMLMHVMRIYASQGYDDFVLSLGYRREVIEDYFDGKRLDWTIKLIDTGETTDTGGRILGCRDVLGDRFMVSYADGLANVSIPDLLAFHDAHDGLATITSVSLMCQYGTLETDADGRVTRFREKPVLPEHAINAGFFVFDREVFDHWQGDNLERDVLPALAAKGKIFTYKHDGFFKSLDSFKDQQELERLVGSGSRPWEHPSNRGDE